MLAKLTKRLTDTLKPSAKLYTVRDTDLPGFTLRVRPNGGMSWFLDYRNDDGRRLSYKIGTYPGLMPDGARRLAQIAAGKVHDHVDVQAEKKRSRAEAERAKVSTLEAFLEQRYAPWAAAHMKSHEEQLKRIRSDFAEYLTKPMAQLHEVAIEGIRRRWLKDGKKPRTVNRDVQRIGSVLSRAVEWQVLDRHPFRGMKQLKFDRRKVPRFLNPQELMNLRKALIARESRMRAERSRMNEHLGVRGKDMLPEHTGEFVDYLRPMVLLSLNCGLRRGELFNLKRTDVDLNARMLTVQGEGGLDSDGSKSSQSRAIPLNAEALSVFEAWLKPKSSGLVFPNPDTGTRLTRIDKSWGSVKAAAGIPKVKFHDLRHTFASRLVQAGVPLNTVRQLMGHEDIETTMIYAHLAPDNLSAAVAKLA